MEYCIVASKYPTEKMHVHVFLDNLVKKFADENIVCNVIAPQSIFSYIVKKQTRRKFKSVRKTDKGSEYTVFSPLCLTLPTLKIGKFHLSDISLKSFHHALKRTCKKNNLKPDVVYSHFIKAGIPGVALAKTLNCASIIVSGESNVKSNVSRYSPKIVKKAIEDATGIIAVSSKNKNEVLEISNTASDKTVVIPNATDPLKFHQLDKLECREKLGFDSDKFIISFTGSFIKRKGIQILCDVLDKFDDVYSIFIGTGEIAPTCKNILHVGRVPNQEIATYLNASDVFVLPTLAEGCCNAIVEAICCGIPVISSDLPFNYDILDSDKAILIDPLSCDDIYKAIKRVKEDKKFKEQLSASSLEKAKSLTMEVRVQKICKFIDEQIKSQGNRK